MRSCFFGILAVLLLGALSPSPLVGEGVKGP